ncbi:hypothetical protein J6590_047153 [Homalodisca vitripennis]|nr:hypothetical protein J6590_047153 [Homalodisca vitripennis]
MLPLANNLRAFFRGGSIFRKNSSPVYCQRQDKPKVCVRELHPDNLRPNFAPGSYFYNSLDGGQLPSEGLFRVTIREEVSILGVPIADRSKYLDFDSDLEIAKVPTLYVTIALFISTIDLVMYPLSPYSV